MGGVPSASKIKGGRENSGLMTVAMPINADGVYSAVSFRPLSFGETLPWAAGKSDPLNISLLYKQGRWGLMYAKTEADYGDHKERVEMTMQLQRIGGIHLQILSVIVSNNRPQGFASEMSQTKSYEYTGSTEKPYIDTSTDVRTVATHMRGLEAVQATTKNILQKISPEDLANVEIFLSRSV
jgi:hypothetical protein